MGSAKDIILRPIARQEADALVKRVHYSGKVVNNSQVHIGVFYRGKLEGAMQFGPSLDKRKIQGLVSGTLWNEFIELNRMAFSDALPRNSESRALGVAMRLLRKHTPHLKWVISFADGTQCGDGTIYRAAGFVLTGITQYNTMLRLANGEVVHRIALNTNDRLVCSTGGRYLGAQKLAQTLGAQRIPGFQLRYIYFLDPTAKERLTVPILPYSEIERRGASMYRGKPRAASIDSDAPAIHAGEDGAEPIAALQEQP